jgi:hypothetical protein
VAKAIAKILSQILARVGSDKLAKIVYYAIMLFVLSTAFGVFGSNPISAYRHALRA